MSLDIDVINSATDKKYTEFSDAIKAELHNKMSNNDISKKYASDYDSIQSMKKLFAQINNTASNTEE